MGTDLVVGVAKGIEDALLEVEIGGGRLGGSCLERLVHAFVSAVLLGTAWGDALVSDPELEPPDVEAIEAVNSGRGEGGAVVAADGVGEAVFTEQTQELGFDPFCAHIQEAVAAEEIAAEVVDDGQGVAVEAIAHEELAFEVDRPDLVGSSGINWRGTRVLPTSATVSSLDPAISLEDVEDGAAGGPSAVRVTCPETLQDLSSTPSVTAVFVEYQLDELVRSLVRARSRSSALIVEAVHSTLPIAVEPFVAGDPADPVASAQLRHSPVTTLEVLNEMMSFEHRVGLQPRHPISPRSRFGESVSHVPGHL